MRKWFTALTLVAAMLGGSVGVGAHQGESQMANMPDCCKKAQSASNTPQVSMARLCCNLNCSEPGSGTSTSSNLSPPQSTTPNTAIVPSATSFNGVTLLGRYAQTSSPHDSSPKKPEVCLLAGLLICKVDSRIRVSDTRLLETNLFGLRRIWR